MKLSIIGAGKLGSEIGHLVAAKRIVKKLVFVDILPELAEGQAEDVAQAIESGTEVMAGWENVAGSKICVIAAGKPRVEGVKDRLELAEINATVIHEVAKEAAKRAPRSIIIMLTNPLDLMNFAAYKATGFQRKRVIGSGGWLDSARLKRIISLEIGKPTASIEAYVLGEHGEGCVPLFSRVKVNGKKRDFSEEEKERISKRLREISAEIIRKKGATVFAPAKATVDIIEAIAKNKKRILPISAVLEGEYGINGISIGVPAVIGKNGIERIEIWRLSKDEHQQLLDAARKLKGYWNSLSI